MSCTHSSTLNALISTTDMKTPLLDLDIETTCSLTKSLCFDSVESPSMSSYTSNTSDKTSWPSAEYNEAMTGVDAGSSYLSSDGQYPGVQGSAYLPITSWRQRSPAAAVTPGVRTHPNHNLMNGASYPSHYGVYQPTGYVKPKVSEQVSARDATPGLPSHGGVNASSCIPQQHLNTCYAYALDRGNGQYTRLIPVDCLPPLTNLPRLQGPEGMIILSAPRGPSPPDTSYSNGYDTAQPVIGTGRPASRSSDTVQNTIDNIVANLPQAPKKRMKVYCDKWLHDGTCAFTQQGCRYKHEMPLDKATQYEVGLFNGLPNWYKKQQAVELSGNSPSLSARSEASPHGGRRALVSGGSWRSGRGGGTQQMQSSPPMHGPVFNYRGNESPVASAGWRCSSTAVSADPFVKRAGNGRLGSGVGSAVSSNPYDLLYEQGAEEIDDGEV